MTDLTICLPDDLREFVEIQVAEEGHASASAYLQVLLQDIRRRKATRNLVAKLDEALDGGPPEPMTREDWDALERNVWERHHRDQSAGTTPA